MNRGVDHQRVFFSDDDRIEFSRRLATIHQRHEIAVIAYCLMSNHYHLLVQVPEPGALSEAMQHVSSVFTRRTNDRLDRDGPVFRGRFHSIPVETDSYLLSAARYIHRNPLDLPDVTDLRRYPWSSYPAYLGSAAVPAFLDPTPVTSLLGSRPDELIALTEGPDAPGASPARTAPGPGPRSIADVRALLRCAIAVEDLAHPTAEPASRPRLDRTVMLLVAARAEDPHLRGELLTSLGPRSERAARVAAARAERRLTSDPQLQRILAWVVAELTSPRHRLAA